MAFRFCANLNFLFTEGNVSLLDKVRLANKAGFKGIEIGYPPNNVICDLIKLQKEIGVETVLLNIALDGDQDLPYGCTAVPDAEDQFRENLYKTIILAKELNCKKIHLMAGKCAYADRENHLETYIENLKYASGELGQENMIGLIEPINNYAVPGYFLNNYHTAINILKDIECRNIKLMVDVFHLQLIQGNISNSFKELKPYIGHVQIAQAPHRHEPDEPGELDFNYVFKAIQDAGYSGWIGCEYKPKNKTTDSLNWIPQYGSF